MTDQKCALQAVELSEVPGFLNDNLSDALAAFAHTASRPPGERYGTGSVGIEPDMLHKLAQKAQTPDARADPADFFLSHFKAAMIKPRASDGSRGFVTAYYEPVVDGSTERTGEFIAPLYSPPDDLVALPPLPGQSKSVSERRFARRLVDGTLVPYPDRKEIDQGLLEGKGLELVWVRDRAEAFFIHVQGSACLQMSDGARMRLSYAAKNGLPFTAIGRHLVDQGLLDRQTISMQSIMGWLRENPDQADEVMWRNKSFIFFRAVTSFDPSDGPIGAGKVPLIAGRSMAVDLHWHTLGTPIFVSANDVNDQSYRRLMVAHDTGSAIVGPARGDLFMGSGANAGKLAGSVKSHADFVMLIPQQANLACLGR